MKQDKSTRHRDFFLTLNYRNDQTEKDLPTYEELIREVKDNFPDDAQFFIMSLERGEDTGRLHYHCYIEFKKKMTWNVIRKTLSWTDVQPRNGSQQDAIDYIKAEGKHAHKSERLEGVWEWGTRKSQGQRSDLAEIIEMIKDGASDIEIVSRFPSQFLRYQGAIGKTREMFRRETMKDQWRDLEVTYIYGDTGSGKTRSVMDQYGYSNVFRVTSYDHFPFDGYEGQDVILFDEFRSSLKIKYMLTLLDGYPVELPARYNHKQAQYTKVFIISNIALEEQYINVQRDEPETFNALLRRIHHTKVMNKERASDTAIELFGVDIVKKA